MSPSSLGTSQVTASRVIGSGGGGGHGTLAQGRGHGDRGRGSLVSSEPQLQLLLFSLSQTMAQCPLPGVTGQDPIVSPLWHSICPLPWLHQGDPFGRTGASSPSLGWELLRGINHSLSPCSEQGWGAIPGVRPHLSPAPSKGLEREVTPSPGRAPYPGG